MHHLASAFFPACAFHIHFLQHNFATPGQTATRAALPLLPGCSLQEEEEEDGTELLWRQLEPVPAESSTWGRRRCQPGRALPFCSFSWHRCQGMHSACLTLIRAVICETLAIYLINHRHKAIKPIF